jgi:hypothetical protein
MLVVVEVRVLMIGVTEQVEETGQKNTVLTLYELTESEATMSQGGFAMS